MASIVLSSIGSSVGNMLVPGVGGRILGTLARRAGRAVDEEIGWSSRAEVKDGARLENLKVQDSRYGLPIATHFGRVRVAGNVIWASDLIETSHEDRVGGGKGGVVSGTFSSTRTTYTYAVNCAIALGFGEIGGIDTIWADSKVIYQNGAWQDGVVGSMTLHAGTADQAVDPMLESWIGAGETPAYQGIAYVVLEGLQLSRFGNRIPNLTFEIVPLDTGENPKWQDAANPGVFHDITSIRNNAMKPLVIEGGAVSARRMLVGGYFSNGYNANVYAIEYDVTGEKPIELARTVSPQITGQDVGAHSWAMGPGGRFVAVGIQDGASGKPYFVMIYDTQTRSFGPALRVNMPMADLRQIAWLDGQRFVVQTYENDKRGLRLFMRAGLSVVDCGFCDVWGAGSISTRYPVSLAHFKSFAGGLLYICGNQTVQFTQLYARALAWKNGKLSIGGEYQFSNTYMGTGSGPQTFLFTTGENEWTMVYVTVSNMKFFSFRPGASSAEVTRPWQTITNASLGLATCHGALVMGNRIIVVHRPSAENIYRLSEIELGEGSFTLVKDAVPIDGFDQPVLDFGIAAIEPTRILLQGDAGYDGSFAQLGIIKRRNTGDTLDHVVGRILQRSGYAPGDYDVSELSGLPLDGYTVFAQATAAGALAPLQVYEPFDLIETSGQLRAVRRRAREPVMIEAHEGGAAGGKEGEAGESILIESRAQELALPREITVDYHDASRDYEIGSQRARKGGGSAAKAMAKIELPLVCTASKAKEIAQGQMLRAWAERMSYRLYLPRGYTALDVGDVIAFNERRIRIEKMRLEEGVLRIDGVAALATDLIGEAEADRGSLLPVGAGEAVESSLFLMDLPLLRSGDDQPGLYAAVTGIEGWPGATLWRAPDGVNFARVASFASAASAGSATSVLASASPFYMDRASRVQVQMIKGSLAGCSETELMNGANAALLGGEIIQFQNATLIGPGLYELSNLLRGRLGTEDQTTTHAIGESFVMLGGAAVQFLPLQLADRNVAVSYRAVSSGGSLDLAQDLQIVPALRTVQPLAPTHIRASRVSGTGSDCTISWVRRARMNAAWIDYVDTPLDEPQELYELEIMNGASLMRTFTGLTNTSVTYTAAQQTADWGGSVPSSFTVNVYQISSRYGRGQKATKTI